MLARIPAGGLELQPERLRQNLLHRPGEVQRQQQRPLLQRLEPVQPPRRHHELQPRPVALPLPPGEPPHRLAPRHRDLSQVPDSARHLTARSTPRARPPPGPPRPQAQAAALRLGPVAQEQVVKPAAIRPHRHHIAHGHQTSASRSERSRSI